MAAADPHTFSVVRDPQSRAALRQARATDRRHRRFTRIWMPILILATVAAVILAARSSDPQLVPVHSGDSYWRICQRVHPDFSRTQLDNCSSSAQGGYGNPIIPQPGQRVRIP